MQIKPSKSDLVLLVIFYCIALPISFYAEDYDDGVLNAILNVFIYFSFSLACLLVIVFILFPKYFPQKKMITLFILVTIFLTLIGSVEIYLYKIINDWEWSVDKEGWSFKSFLQLFYHGITSSIENTGILLGLFLGKKFYDAQLNLQINEKEKRESELKALKAQIDPHFLFNSLNTVDALIDSRPSDAKSYLARLSKMYRYLITTKDEDLVPLEEELSFARDFIFLTQTRFGNDYNFEFSAQDDTSTHLVAPGAVQTLLENVVKHNFATAESPVNTEIIVKKSQIIVRNNMNKKPNSRTTGTGLDNLISRYRLLSDKKIEILQAHQNKAFFEVKIPSIKSQ